MGKIDAVKERISYRKGLLTMIMGIMVLTVGGLITLYTKGKLSFIFWVGVGFLFFLFFVFTMLMIHIEKLINKLEKL